MIASGQKLSFFSSASSPGKVRKDWFDSEEEAVIAEISLCNAKQKKGYQSVLVTR
jgi:predicted DNA-binding WGR domain protein